MTLDAMTLDAMTLDSEDDLARHLKALTRADPRLRPVLRTAGTVPLRRRQPGLPALVSIVVSQQLSTASAAAIWGRLERAVRPMTARRLIDAPEETLRACGLSAPKLRTIAAVAEAVAGRRLPLPRLAAMPANEAHGHLVAVKGIGPWTADIYLLFALGHPDAFPAGDLALQEAARHALGLDERPDARSLAEIAEDWRPRRGVAAKLLWANYRAIKTREGAPA